ncbi:uncharacterized protein J3D65DRAFT_481285 [Phyllosticta citribraziliensis]|uniref:Uncharacterized protein n=1 Tax=Phyllosticta citribraziliensis TaxID=989973 RepID=A0ABR1LGH1_9PEZI
MVLFVSTACQVWYCSQSSSSTTLFLVPSQLSQAAARNIAKTFTSHVSEAIPDPSTSHPHPPLRIHAPTTTTSKRCCCPPAQPTAAQPSHHSTLSLSLSELLCILAALAPLASLTTTSKSCAIASHRFASHRIASHRIYLPPSPFPASMPGSLSWRQSRGVPFSPDDRAAPHLSIKTSMHAAPSAP